MRALCLSRSLCLCLALLAVAGCSTEAWYEGAKRGAEANCRKQPPGAAEECLSRLNPSRYDDYEKEKEKARAGKQQ